ncbi:MAG: BREX system P-loop protein BrxC [Halanaerobiales bacterium]
MKIRDLFKMNFEKEIEAVIKVGEYDEKSATEEINNYIVTDQIADNLESFIDYYDGLRKDTGVWISGFYGSGKSYLAKIIGYLLENPDLMGMEARDLFKNRLVGLDNKALIENKLAGLSKYQTKTVVFDVSGESLAGTFYKKLLLNFLKAIGLPKTYIGYTEYQLMKTNDYQKFLKKCDELSQNKVGQDWDEVRNNKAYAPGILKQAWLAVSDENSEDIDRTIDRMHNLIENIDADELVGELDTFLEMEDNDYDRIVFIVDEVSEAIDKNHIELSELRGTAQHLSQNGEGKYWFLATAQEKLDNILSRKNINQNDLNIITDRFQKKIHLSSAQVDKVTKERVLAKTEAGKEKLREFYENNNGGINSLDNLSGKFDTSIDSVDEFIDYYPFHNYQMRLLKNFLYAVFQQAQAGGSERGMLITVDRLLKNEDLFEKEIGKFVSAYQLCDYGFPTPQSELQEKFNQAQNDLEDEGQKEVNGAYLLKTLFFLEKSEDLKRTLDNIVKAYNNDLTFIGKIKPEFKESLELLEEKNYVLEESKEYKITSDIEENMMQEMNMINADWENRINLVRSMIKELPFITNYSTNRVGNKTYNIAIRDEKENLLSAKSGEVKLTVYNVLNVDDDIERELEAFKSQYVELDEALLVPDIEYKDEIDKLAASIYKYESMINRNKNTTDEDKEKVVDSFRTIVNNKRSDLQLLIEKSYYNSWLIYDFNENKISQDNMNTVIDKIESEMIDKTFSKRLKASLDQRTAEKLLTVDNNKLKDYCNEAQFNFFDSSGSFIGEDLRVVTEIDQECQDKDGRNGSGLIDKFQQKPYGWETSDIIGTLAALMRAGNLKIKYQGNTYRDYAHQNVKKVFTNSREFQKAKFYTTIGGGISASKKHQVVNNLLDIDNRGKVDIDYEDNDFQAVNKITLVASEYIRLFSALKNKVEPEIIDYDRDDIEILKGFAKRDISDSNLSKEADDFINNKDKYESAVAYINKLAHFVDHEYMDYKDKTQFIHDVKNQLSQAEDSKLKDEIKELIQEYTIIENKDIVNHRDQLQAKYTAIRQKFNELFKGYFEEFIKVSENLLKAAKEKIEEIEAVDTQTNNDFYNQLKDYISSNKRLMDKEFVLSKREAKETSMNRSLNEIIMATELKESKIKEVKEFVPEPPDNGNNEKKVYQLEILKKTRNLTYIKNKLNEAINDIESENYDEFEIKTK